MIKLNEKKKLQNFPFKNSQISNKLGLILYIKYNN